MPDRYQIYDTKNNQTVYVHQPLRTKMIARRVRQEMARLTGEPVRFIVIPGPEHKKHGKHERLGSVQDQGKR